MRAPAGYGKTTAVAESLSTASGPTAVWVRCREAKRWSHDATRHMWESLISGLTTYGAGIDTQATDSYAGLAVTAAAGLQERLTIVIDDYHLVSSPETDLALTEFARVSPLLRVIVCARRTSLLEGALVAATFPVHVVGPSHFLLTPTESRAYASAAGVLPSSSLTAALERANGWPLALRAALSSAPSTASDPLARLASFAHDLLTTLTSKQRRLLLAAAELDAISLDHATYILDGDATRSLRTAQSLEDLGLLVSAPLEAGPGYACHPAVRAPLANSAAMEHTPTQRCELFRRRADELANSSPVEAFDLLCAAQDFGAAEAVLASNFAAVTALPAEWEQRLNGVSEEALASHPTLTAALFYCESSHAVPPGRLGSLFILWCRALTTQSSAEVAPDDRILRLSLATQAMVAARLAGELGAAKRHLRKVETLIAGEEARRRSIEYLSSAGNPGGPAARSLPVYYREVAMTALALGEPSLARRALERLRSFPPTHFTAVPRPAQFHTELAPARLDANDPGQ